MPQDAERAAAALAVDVQPRLDFRFENVQVLVDSAGGHAPEFAVNQGQVRENRQAQRQKQGAGPIGPMAGCFDGNPQASPGRWRRGASMRSIWPWSVSWS